MRSTGMDTRTGEVEDDEGTFLFHIDSHKQDLQVPLNFAR